MMRLQNAEPNGSVGPLECIFIALPKIGSLCGLGGTSTFLLHEGTRTFFNMMEQFDSMHLLFDMAPCYEA